MMSKTLLIVDDEQDILDSLSRLLQGQGYRIYVAQDVQTGLACVQTHQINAVLSDYRMPEMNGAEFLHQVREISPQTLRLIISAHTDSDFLLESINVGHIHGFITKPWDNQDLLEQLAKAFAAQDKEQLDKNAVLLDEPSEHDVLLNKLSEQQGLNEKVRYVHKILQKQRPYIARIAIALYNANDNTIATFAASPLQESQLIHYWVSLDEAQWLKHLAQEKKARVIQDTSSLSGPQQHQKVPAQFAASYTVPLFDEGKLIGFIFFNSLASHIFDDTLIRLLDICTSLLEAQLIKELSTTQVIAASLKTALDLAHRRDPETGSHLDRMESYARVIVQELADELHLTDEMINLFVFFTRLHDIGKVAIPDSVLLKPARLEEEEFQVMRSHTVEGAAIIDNIIKSFDFENAMGIDMLRNIVLYHHEDWDGTGYPEGLRGAAIPIEARIVSVCDVFDALTTTRPYKQPWSFDDTYTEIERLSRCKFDPHVVEVFIAQREAIRAIYDDYQ